MEERTTLKIILGSGRNERVVYSKQFDTYDPDILNRILSEALLSVASSEDKAAIEMLRSDEVEVSLSVFLDETGLRPSLHLNSQTISLLSEAGVSLDIDPYVYD